MNARAKLLLSIADDELIVGWRDSEWTGIAPLLEEDVAFSSISQNEVGHARALYQLVAEELDVSFARVVVVLGDTSLVPNQGATIASETIQITAVPLRKEPSVRPLVEALQRAEDEISPL